MSSKPGCYLLSLFFSSCLVLLSVSLYSHKSKFTLYASPSNPTSFNGTVNNNSNVTNFRSDLSSLDAYYLMDSPITPNQRILPLQSTKAILPVVADSIERLHNLVAPFLSSRPYILEVVIVCPGAIISRVETILHNALLPLGAGIDHPDITLLPSHSSSDLLSTVLEAASDFTIEWALIIDDTGLADISYMSWLQTQDISAPSVSFHGQRATREEEASVNYLGSYLRPPFLFPSDLVRSFRESWDISRYASWKDFILYMNRLSSTRSDDSLSIESSTSPNLPVPGYPLDKNAFDYWDVILDGPSLVNISGDEEREVPPSPGSRFLFFLPDSKDLQRLHSLVCAIQLSRKVFHIDVVIYDEQNDMFGQNNKGETHFIQGDECRVEYEVIVAHSAFPRLADTLRDKWAFDYRFSVGVVFLLDINDAVVASLTRHPGKSVFPEATFIKIPPSDLDQSVWMSTLSMRAWKSWYVPQIDITVITKDRPHSLRRLLKSLLSARYFGDIVTLRVNVEQDCDAETLKIVENVVWPFGPVFIHRRVIHGGLLPAVVESWYPQGNHSYGLLLEDDVELSPLFYAWIKMTVLQYRYSESNLNAYKLFGISLYQQKYLELPLSGRQKFSPRTLFSRAGLRNANTPYLSQVPCSWGAVYFPEHWREFHDYLSLRLTETVMKLDTEVVPGVRSNFWSKSWKRFYIELVYLRGYVMLYPNYEDFLSLSTNHLEVGSHVKVRSKEKRNLFLLPLVPLSEPQGPCKLLDMPDQTLPDLDVLPVLDLIGFFTTFDKIAVDGEVRRLHLLNCTHPTHVYNIKSLMCITAPSPGAGD